MDAMSTSDIKALESNLIPIEKYALDFAQSTCLHEQAQRAAVSHDMQKSRQDEWELGKLEQDREIMEVEGDEEIIAAIDEGPLSSLSSTANDPCGGTRAIQGSAAPGSAR